MPEKFSASARTSVFDDFLALSRILTGVDNLDAELGRKYLDRLNSSPFNPLLSQILKRFQCPRVTNTQAKPPAQDSG